MTTRTTSSSPWPDLPSTTSAMSSTLWSARPRRVSDQPLDARGQGGVAALHQTLAGEHQGAARRQDQGVLGAGAPGSAPSRWSEAGRRAAPAAPSGRSSTGGGWPGVAPAHLEPVGARCGRGRAARSPRRRGTCRAARGRDRRAPRRGSRGGDRRRNRAAGWVPAQPRRRPVRRSRHAADAEDELAAGEGEPVVPVPAQRCRWRRAGSGRPRPGAVGASWPSSAAGPPRACGGGPRCRGSRRWRKPRHISRWACSAATSASRARTRSRVWRTSAASSRRKSW